MELWDTFPLFILLDSYSEHLNGGPKRTAVLNGGLKYGTALGPAVPNFLRTAVQTGGLNFGGPQVRTAVLESWMTCN